MVLHKGLRIAAIIGLSIAVLSDIARPAYAACTSPAGNAGAITWNGTDSVIWCDGTTWYALKSSASASGSAGYIQFSDGSGGFASDSGLNWDNTNKRLGINVSSPSSDLSFGGGANRMIGMTSRSGDGDGFSLTIRSGATSSGATDRNGGPLYLSSGVATGTGSSAIYFRTATPQGSTNTTSNTPTDKMTILGNGNVGIGTTSPVSALTIGETGNASGEVAANTIRSGSGGRYGIGFNTGVAGTFNLFGHSTAQQIGIGFDTGSFGTFSSVVTVKPSGNVGIGTASPVGRLHVSTGNSGQTTPGANADDIVVESAGNTGLTVLSGTAGTGQINFGDSGNAAQGRITYDHSNDSLSVHTNATQALTILSSGNVGIGATAPATSLHISSGNAAGLIIERPATLNSGIEFRQTGGSIFAGIATGLDFAIGAGNNLEASLFKVSSAGKLKISAPDNTATQLSLISDRRAIVSTDLIGGVDFQSNDSQLTAPGTVAASIKALAAATHTASELGTDLTFSTTTGTTFAERMRVTAAGNVGIGTASPSEALTVNGNPEFQGASKKLRIVPDSTGITYLQVGTDNTDATGEIRLTRYKTTSTSFAKFSSYATTNYLAGNVGIGIATPAAALHVSGTDSTAYVSSSASAYSPADLSSPAAPMVLIANTANLDGQGVYLNLLSKNAVADGQRAYIGAISNSTGRSPNIVIGQQNGTTSYIERMRIAAGGNVGIGTTTPAAKLDVNGFMRLAKNGSAPATCDATIDGAIALTSARRMCVCDATSWVEVNSATACTW